MTAPTPQPAVGQVWRDDDPRVGDRYVRIVAVDATHVTVRQVQRAAGGGWADVPGGRRTRIRRTRLKPGSTGYRHVGRGDA